ncbi:MAG: DUF711 family protein [Anaerolineaceae bacterium]|nr:DUF711 family protein [Anaerolineaceae bacterium]
MKIRSITCFYHPGSQPSKAIPKLAQQIEDLKNKFTSIGWEVQTTRLATVPFGIYTTPKTAVHIIQSLETAATDYGFNYISVGPARINHPEEYKLIPEILSATRNVFSTGILAHIHRGISTAAVKACAEIITQAASISPDGFANLRFCATSNVRPFTPFFPAAYSYGTQPGFALAIEAADAAIDAFQTAKTIAEGKFLMLAHMHHAAEKLTAAIRQMNLQWELPFKGFDFSLAPFPEDWCSLAQAMENLGVEQIGMMGSLSAATILAETLDRGKWLKVGFNGLMLPVLEDSILATRSVEGSFSIKDLLMYSAVCGTGLDTIPLPGNITADKIEPLLMDIAALSLRLNKPLTARLMPVPGLKTGEMTKFNFDFFKNGKILDFPASRLGRTLSASNWIEIHSRY